MNLQDLLFIMLMVIILYAVSKNIHTIYIGGRRCHDDENTHEENPEDEPTEDDIEEFIRRYTDAAHQLCVQLSADRKKYEDLVKQTFKLIDFEKKQRIILHADYDKNKVEIKKHYDEKISEYKDLIEKKITERDEFTRKHDEIFKDKIEDKYMKAKETRIKKFNDEIAEYEKLIDAESKSYFVYVVNLDDEFERKNIDTDDKIGYLYDDLQKYQAEEIKNKNDMIRYRCDIDFADDEKI